MYKRQTYNIIGELTGRNPDRKIMLSAHYDSYFDGFQDDNTAISMMLGMGKALVETLFMGLIVIIVSELWGNRLGARFAAKVSDPQRDNPYFCRLMRQAGTVSVMCPTMSLAATIIFSMILGGAPVWQLPAIWAGTLIKNFPMAFFWNMFAAAPFTNWACGKLFE